MTRNKRVNIAGLVLLIAGGLFFFCSKGFAATYYVAANGNDANDGLSKATPWAHAPGMPNCVLACKAKVPVAGDRFIFRGGDTWHFGNGSGLTPHSGGTWDMYIAVAFGGNDPTCLFDGVRTGCVYFGVDSSWFTGPSWSRPKLDGDNAPSLSRVAACTYQTADSLAIPTLHNTMVSLGIDTIFDNFEMTGLCTQRASSSNVTDDSYITFLGSGTAGKGTAITSNLYAHGWTASTLAGLGANGVLGPQPGNDDSITCIVLSGTDNGLESFDQIVIDGSDSKPGVCAWAAIPPMYHMRHSIIRYTTQGVVSRCHDIHDNIFEYFDSPDVITHGNLLECNTDAFGNEINQPQNSPNVFYNNIVRHTTTAFSASGHVTLWFCPNNMPEYWFNNIVYDVGNSNYWDIAGPDAYAAPPFSCTNAGGQYMFNNILVDGTAPCGIPPNTTGGKYLHSFNNLLINSPWDSGTVGCEGGPSSSSNVSISDTVAVQQGIGTATGRTNTQRTGTINCANDSTKPCSPITATSPTVGRGVNKQSYCAALASFTAEHAISVEAANACNYGTSDGCSYNATVHAMTCPAQTLITRPLTALWDSGSYQFTISTAPQPPLNLQVIAQ